MKNNKIWYFGYVLGIGTLILTHTLKLSEVINIILTYVGALFIAISHVRIMHNRMMEKDKDYKISVNDERNEVIRDKVNATMGYILILLMGFIAVVSISIKAYIPAALLGGTVIFSPIIMYFINRYYEKKY